ncbi:MAG: hypothetical protein HZA88_20765 [Verrucomicrobia bacterium]|nr:hypothetical protein [Verrucomicrobiota bacterium]
MKLFYVTLPKSKARRILEGKLRLADVKLPRHDSDQSPDAVELHDELEPPLKPDKQVVLRIGIPKTEEELEPCLIAIEDNPDNIYDIPRSWLDEATCNIVPDVEVLEFCKQNLNSIIRPCGPMFWKYVQECVDSGKTRGLSPFYIRAYQETRRQPT